LVLCAAAEDGRVAATASQCPLLDGRAAAMEKARYAGAFATLRLGVHGLRDVARALVCAAPHYIPIVARPGEVGPMTRADADQGLLRLARPSFRNELTARTSLMVPFFRPIQAAPRVRCPALLQICDQDSVAPVASVEA